MAAGSCVDHRQEMLLTPTITSSQTIQQHLHHTGKALADSEVLLCWRGSISDEAFEVIDDDGNILASGLPRDSDARRAVSIQEPLLAATGAAIPAATPARLAADAPMEVSSQQLAHAKRQADGVSAVSSQQFAPVATPSYAAFGGPHLVAPDQAANWPPQPASQPQAKPPPWLCGEPPEVLGREMHAEMEQGAEMEQRTEAERRRRMIRQHEFCAEEAAMCRLQRLLLARQRERDAHAGLELFEAQAAMDHREAAKREALLAQHEEAAAVRFEERRMRMEHLEVREREGQQAEQMEEEAARRRRAGEKRRHEMALAEPRQQSTEERQDHAASSQEGQEGQAASSQSRQAARHRGVPLELQVWLARRNLAGVHDCDQHGWSALHHVARDSRTEMAAEGIFEELCQHVWSPAQLDAVTGEAPRSEHLPQGWTALHILANGPGMQRGRMAQRLLELKANPMPLTARGATPLHTAAGTGNHEVAKVLLLAPGLNVNLKNKDNKTPYDVATSNKTMLDLVANAGGLPSLDRTGTSARHEPNARKRGGPVSEARRKRAAEWRSVLS